MGTGLSEEMAQCQVLLHSGRIRGLGYKKNAHRRMPIPFIPCIPVEWFFHAFC